MQNLPPDVDYELRKAILRRGGSDELARVVLAANERARDKEDENRALRAEIARLRDTLDTIAGMHDYEASVGDLASAMYEAACMARQALKGNR